MSRQALVPRTPPTVTTTQRNAITASEGDVVKNSTTGYMEVYLGGVWLPVSTGKSGQIVVGFDGGGVVLTANKQQDLQVPFAGTITDWAFVGDTTGSAVVDVWKKSTFPPAVGQTITASAKPTISAANSASSSTLTGWTTSLAVGDWLRFNLDSVSSFTRLLLIINYTKS
jgi:hypothetical protein